MHVLDEKVHFPNRHKLYRHFQCRVNHSKDVGSRLISAGSPVGSGTEFFGRAKMSALLPRFAKATGPISPPSPGPLHEPAERISRGDAEARRGGRPPLTLNPSPLLGAREPRWVIVIIFLVFGIATTAGRGLPALPNLGSWPVLALSYWHGIRLCRCR